MDFHRFTGCRARSISLCDSIKALSEGTSETGQAVCDGLIMIWFIIGGVVVALVGLYIGNAYYQAHKRREALKRKKQEAEQESAAE